MQRKSSALLDPYSPTCKSGVAACRAKGRLGGRLGGSLVADLAVRTLNVLELELTLNNLGEELITLWVREGADEAIKTTGAVGRVARGGWWPW